MDKSTCPRKATIPLPLRGTRLRVGPLCRCATSPHTVGSHPLHKEAFKFLLLQFLQFLQPIQCLMQRFVFLGKVETNQVIHILAEEA